MAFLLCGPRRGDTTYRDDKPPGHLDGGADGSTSSCGLFTFGGVCVFRLGCFGFFGCFGSISSFSVIRSLAVISHG